ncbi:MAG: FHA domain-containing protein [Planctomycetaceae bacterium]
MLQAELRVTSGKQSGHVIPLVHSRFLIGREEDCHLRPNSDLVSRHHCVFKLDDYSLRVRDLGSTNGTLVNGERLHGEAILSTGDRVCVGKLEFEVAIGAAAARKVGVAAGSAPSDPTDSFELGDTPVSPTATMQFAAFNGADAGEETTDAPYVESHTSVQETVALQGDTMFAGHAPSPMQQPGYPQQGMGYPMPYPQPAYPYGQPYGMPMMGYPPPMAYPQMGMYPQQPMPGPVYPPQELPPPAASSNRTPAPDVRLPKPGETGAKPPEPKGDSNGTRRSDTEVTRDSAAEIIKQYTQRRPQV